MTFNCLSEYNRGNYLSNFYKVDLSHKVWESFVFWIASYSFAMTANQSQGYQEGGFRVLWVFLHNLNNFLCANVSEDPSTRLQVHE